MTCFWPNQASSGKAQRDERKREVEGKLSVKDGSSEG